MRLRPGATRLSARWPSRRLRWRMLVSSPSAATLANDEKAIVHVLNRIGFGPRPGDVERIQRIGLRQYIDQQLHPERVPDPGMAARLAGLQTVGLSSRDIAERLRAAHARGQARA